MMGDDETGALAGDGHEDDGTLHAWLDGALAPADAARVAAHVTACATCAAATAEARGLIAASSRILGTLDDEVGAVRAIRPPAVRRRRRAGWPTGLRAAAVLVVVAGSTLLVLQRSRTPGDAASSEARSEVRAAAATPPPAPSSTPSPAPTVATAPMASGGGVRSPLGPAFRQSAVRLSEAATAAGDAAPAAPIGGCYEVIEPTAADVGGRRLPRRFVLDTMPVAGRQVAHGDSGAGLRYAVRVDDPAVVAAHLAAAKRVAVTSAAAPPQAYWRPLSRDSVRVVLGDRITLIGRVTASGLTGTVATARAEAGPPVDPHVVAQRATPAAVSPVVSLGTAQEFAARRCATDDSSRTMAPASPRVAAPAMPQSPR